MILLTKTLLTLTLLTMSILTMTLLTMTLLTMTPSNHQAGGGRAGEEGCHEVLLAGPHAAPQAGQLAAHGGFGP